MPYIMASMHPLMHLTFLITSTILYFTEYKNFFEVPNAKNCTNKEALHFINGGGERLFTILVLAHLFAIVLHWGGECMINSERHTIGKIMILAKVFVYIMVHFAVQSSILFTDCRKDIVDKS